MLRLTLFLTLLINTCFIEASDIIVSKGIKEKLRIKIENDLAVLEELQFKTPSEKTLELMELQDLSTQSVTHWLEERVNYVVEENSTSFLKQLFGSTISAEQKNIIFPNQDILPYSLEIEASAEDRIDEGAPVEGVTVMTNLGAAIYLKGKTEGILYSMKISRGILKKSTKIEIESPRAGVIQIGEGLFAHERTINNKKPESRANSINRLSTFFHEARHSDGNGLSLSFAHATCPIDHDLAGIVACDESSNGAYAVSSAMTIEMIKACDEACSEREKEMLKLMALDYQNRILETTHKNESTKAWDTTPESL